MVAPVLAEILPGPVRLQLMVSAELARLAVKGMAAPPTVTLAVVGDTLRVGVAAALMVMVAEAVSVPAVAVTVAVVAPPVAGGV